MSLFGSIGRSIGLRMLKSRAKNAREGKLGKGWRATMKFLDGKKNLIVALGVVIAGLVHIATGQDIGPILYSVFASLGWSDELSSKLAAFATAIIPLLWASWASLDKIIKAYKQYRAGATPTETLTDVGSVKLAIAEGVIPIVPIIEKKDK